jgi:mannose-6-phosphate isomerase-like protein (cupin superfamily)
VTILGHLPDDAPIELIAQARDLASEVEFFVGLAGFRIDAVFPADNPTTALVSRRDLRVRILRGATDQPVRLRTEIDTTSPSVLRSPGGSIVEIVPGDEAIVVPEGISELLISRASADGSWVTGRAGMRYRDLLPGRWGGRFIVSHIHIPDAGPVPDYVHYHRVRFQMIVVKSGWVEVVYEDQGPPFVIHAGDAVLQPPQIRHRVLNSSADLEVIEIGCPAEHMTLAEHDIALPTTELLPDRDYGGQRFARFALSDSIATPWRIAGYQAHDTGFAAATDGLVGARLVEPGERTVTDPVTQETEFSMLVVLAGHVVLDHDGVVEPPLDAGDSVALPSGTAVRLVDPSDDLRLLDVTVPA